MSEKSISDSKENFEIRDKSMPSSDTIERTVLSQYNFNYNVSGNDGYDVSSQLVIDETYANSQTEQSQKSENIIFPEQDMSVYECSQPESDSNTIMCPNRVIFSSEVMEFVNSQNSCDNDVGDNDKQNIKCDDVDDDRMVAEINGNNSDDIECNKCDSGVTEYGREEKRKDEEEVKEEEEEEEEEEEDDSIRSVDKSEGDSIGLEFDVKDDELSSERVQAIDLSIARDEIERPVRSLTPCLDEKSESETGEISDSNDNCSVPVILSKNVLNKIQIENGAVTTATTTAAVSSVVAAPASAPATTFTATTPDAHSDNCRSASLQHFPTLHSRTNEIDKESIQFKKVNKSTKDRNYRDQFCNGNSFAKYKKAFDDEKYNRLFCVNIKRKQSPSFVDMFGRNKPRLESESFSAIKKHLASDGNQSVVTKTKRKVHRNDDEDSIDEHRKSSHKKSKKSSSSPSSLKRRRRSKSRTSILSVSSSASSSSSSRLSTTIPLYLPLPTNIRAPLSSSGGGTSGFVGGSNSRHYTPPIKHNIKVIVSNDRVQEKNSKKNDQKKNRRHNKSDKRRRKRRRQRTSPTIGSSFITQLPQSKKVYSTGNNILVSLTVDPKTTTTTKTTNPSNIDEDIKPIIVPNMRIDSEENLKSTKHAKHSKNKKKSKKTKKSKKAKKAKKSSSKKLTDSNRKSTEGHTSPKLSNSRILNTNIDALKTLAIFDLEQSPVRELTPEPVPVIEISDSDEPCCKTSTANKNGGGNSSGTDQLSTNQSSMKLRVTNANKVSAGVDKESKSKPEKKKSELTSIESQLEHRLNQALNRFPSSLINTANTATTPVVIETTPETMNKNSLTLATTPRSPDVYDPFEPTSSPVSSSSLNFYKNSTTTTTTTNNNNNSEQPSIMKNSSSISNHPIDSNKNSSFSSDEVSSNHKTNSHPTDSKSPHKTHHSGGSSGGGGRATNSTSEPHDSPYSPGMSDFDDIYDPEAVKQVDKIKLAEQLHSLKVVSKAATATAAVAGVGTSVPKPKVAIANSNFNNNHNDFSSTKTLTNNNSAVATPAASSAGLRLSEENLRILGQMPNVTNTKDNSTHYYVNKLNRQERVVEEVKFVLKPEYSKKKITKEQYKEILRKSVPKILHNRSGVINPIKIRTLILAYVKKYHYINKHGGPICDTKSDN